MSVRTMKPTEFWKNFRLGEELSVSGTFIYNGVKRFHELKKLDFPDELFEVFYSLAVGLERLIKIAVVLLEHKDGDDQAKFEESLISHNHQELMARVQKLAPFSLGQPHKDFLNLLARFYKQMRYGRFSLESVADFDRERRELTEFLARHLPDVSFPAERSIFGIENDDRYRNFLRKVVLKISNGLYKAINARAAELGLSTGELRHASKAQTVFLGEADIPAEVVLWKELLIFFMNTKESNGYLNFLRGLKPLDLDPADVGDFLDCFQSDASKALVVDSVEQIYIDMDKEERKERLQMMGVIASPNAYFPEDDEEDEEPSEDGYDWELKQPKDEK